MEEGGLTATRPEDLLIMYASAIENRNVAAAQQAVHALQSISSVDGALPSERVVAYFLRALMIRAGTLLQSSQNLPPELDLDQYMQDNPHQERWGERALGFNDLTNLVDMTPYYRFGYMAANGAILETFEGMERVHIVDLSTSHCMQWPTLIDALADRTDGPPHVRLSLHLHAPNFTKATPLLRKIRSPPRALGTLKCVPFEFHMLSQPLESLCISDIDIRDGEWLAVNCSLRLHYLADESLRLGFRSCGAAELQRRQARQSSVAVTSLGVQTNSYLGDCHAHAGERTFLSKCDTLNAAAASLFSLNMQCSQLRFGGN